MIPVAHFMTPTCLIDCEYCQDLDNQSANVNNLCLFIDLERCSAFDKLFFKLETSVFGNETLF